ncbi:MAG: TetR/AcrR family transcriptional regulator, partial [Planctomycetota bacterium]
MKDVSPAKAGKALKRKLLLTAAYDVFSTKGYHRTRLEDVAAQAGYSKGSVYNYFEDKEELFLQTSISASADIVAVIAAEVQPDSTAIEALRRMLRHLLSDAGELYSFVQAVAEYHGELQRSDEHGSERNLLIAEHLKGLRGILQVLAGAIRAGKERGEFNKNLDEMVIARLLTGLVRSVLLRWRLDGQKSDLEEELSQIMIFAESGLRGPDPRNGATDYRAKHDLPKAVY